MQNPHTTKLKPFVYPRGHTNFSSCLSFLPEGARFEKSRVFAVQFLYLNNQIFVFHQSTQLTLPNSFLNTSIPQHLMNLTAIKFILYTHHLKILFTSLKQNNVEFIVLKGWSFIPDLYPDPATRPFSDIDILIHPKDYHAVTSHMASLGFVRALVRAGSEPTHPASNPAVRAASNPAVRAASNPAIRAGSNPAVRAGSKPAHTPIPLEITFSHPAGIHIDLHTHLLTLAWWQPAFPIDLDYIWHTAQPYQDSTGHQLLRLSPEITFLHLCLHLWNHEPLNPHHHSYIDLVLLLRKYSHSMHWDHILHLADDWGLRNILYWVTQILHRDYHIALPIQINPKSSPTSLTYKFIHSQFSQSLKTQSSILPKASEVQPGANPNSWSSSFLLRIALIDHPTQILKLLWNAIFPSKNLRTAIHNQPCTVNYRVRLYQS
ncbi:MAG: hypothetical protein CVU41_18355 [Chloroflexi bacterium HGW-Chloroflexi-3]|nr:MAG: hypothetical protein CVU41_18355 [Chloroflexi bacterium HGW-Chloroflexi-3]